MAYDEYLAERIARQLRAEGFAYEEKKMMGGIAFMVDGKMCVGVMKSELMARVGPDGEGKALGMTGARPMDFTGRPMRGYISVGPEGTDRDESLAAFIRMALDFNPQAKASRKRK